VDCIFPIEYFAAMALAHRRLKPLAPVAGGNGSTEPFRQRRTRSGFLRPLRVGESLSSGARRADIAGFGVPEHQGEGSLLPMLVRSGNLRLEIGSSGGAGFTREVENGKRSLGTRGNLLSGCRSDAGIRARRATNAARHAGIGVPTHHKRTVRLRPPHEHR